MGTGNDKATAAAVGRGTADCNAVPAKGGFDVGDGSCSRAAVAAFEDAAAALHALRRKRIPPLGTLLRNHHQSKHHGLAAAMEVEWHELAFADLDEGDGHECAAAAVNSKWGLDQRYSQHGSLMTEASGGLEIHQEALFCCFCCRPRTLPVLSLRFLSSAALYRYRHHLDHRHLLVVALFRLWNHRFVVAFSMVTPRL
mmetsp:Transcript_62167/g.124608  ORF Transcript_62167/g.124608 Transcript_62167/m.124608 type:complete len:198 (+) Transcript_62167:200-793(+)